MVYLLPGRNDHRCSLGPPFPFLTAQKFRPSNTEDDDDGDGGGEIHFGKVICGIVLMSNQAVPPCYLASQGKEEVAAAVAVATATVASN